MLDGQDIADALAGAVRGDEASFAVLWRALNPPLLRYLRVLIPGACEDVASETWLQASRDLGGFTGDAKQFQVWLFRIARNRAIDEGRRNQRVLDLPVPTLPEQRSSDDTAEEALAAMATRRALAAIAALPRDQAEAVLLRAVAGLSADQARLGGRQTRRRRAGRGDAGPAHVEEAARQGRGTGEGTGQRDGADGFEGGCNTMRRRIAPSGTMRTTGNSPRALGRRRPGRRAAEELLDHTGGAGAAGVVPGTAAGSSRRTRPRARARTRA